MSLSITSTAFKQGERIPAKYTCDGSDISPGLEWSDVPEGTRSFTLIADDPDAPVGTWIHWVLYNVPGETRSLPEAVPSDASLPDGSRQGKNSWGRPSYGGPCPPRGTHRYFFRLYALDTVLQLRSGVSEGDLLKAMKGHILAEAELMGLYSRK
jgi:Raf kinase inhibitor-like YbhB/YbcL family protein